ncbi:MAG: hypothetical protein VYC38_01990, partial [Pseudomonadota bacterium]|nr:hypothetical protein [Pseudomonadota bacterium]
EALTKLQNFDTSTLSRRDDLGSDMNFEAAIPPALRLIELYRRLPLPSLKELPQPALEKILTSANSSRKLFDSVQAFTLQQANPADQRTAIIQNITNQYDAAFNQLHQWISYGVTQTVDFNSLDAQARAAARAIEDRANEMEEAFQAQSEQLTELEQQYRQALAEQGVTKQAEYFHAAAEHHKVEGDKWAKYTWRWSVAVAFVAFLSFFTHRIPFIAPQNIPEAIQFIASKVLLIGAFSFMMIRAASNYRAHRHNEVVNRHKQNSLLTFNALAEAGSTQEARNIILNHASASISAQPESGYVRGGADGGSQQTNKIDLMPRLTAPLSGQDS